MLTGVLMAAEDDGLRMVATDSYRLAVRDLPGDDGARRRPEGAGARRGRSPNCSVLLGPTPSSTVRLGEREATFEVGGTRLTTRLIEGEFPNYRNLHPVVVPEPADGRPRRAAGGDPPREDPGPGLHAGAPHARRRQRCSSTAITQDVGNADEEIDATYDGDRDDRGVQPRLPRRRRRGAVDGDEVSLETHGPDEAGGAPRRRAATTTSTC